MSAMWFSAQIPRWQMTIIIRVTVFTSISVFDFIFRLCVIPKPDADLKQHSLFLFWSTVLILASSSCTVSFDSGTCFIRVRHYKPYHSLSFLTIAKGKFLFWHHFKHIILDRNERQNITQKLTNKHREKWGISNNDVMQNKAKH